MSKFDTKLLIFDLVKKDFLNFLHYIKLTKIE